MTTDQHRADLLRWAEALESGEYKQTNRQLKCSGDSGPTYCCLGVAAEIGIAKARDDTIVYGFCGLSAEDIGTLAEANDAQHMTFPEIAAAIRHYVKYGCRDIGASLAVIRARAGSQDENGHKETT